MSSIAPSPRSHAPDSPPRFARIRATPFDAALGAEISGVDLSQRLDQQTAAEINGALAEFEVLVFRDQELTPEQHIAIAERLGGVDVNRFFRPVDGYPLIAEVRKESAGGDTMFASATKAFASLSAGLQATLRTLRAHHSSRHVFGAEGAIRAQTDLPGRVLNPELATQDALHPVVFLHPLNGREALYVNPGFTLRFDGWTQAESAPLLAYLYEQVAREDFAYRLVWRLGTLTLWDNRTTWHKAVNDYPGERRVLHRITLAGEPLN